MKRKYIKWRKNVAIFNSTFLTKIQLKNILRKKENNLTVINMESTTVKNVVKGEN